MQLLTRSACPGVGAQPGKDLLGCLSDSRALRLCFRRGRTWPRTSSVLARSKGIGHRRCSTRASSSAAEASSSSPSARVRDRGSVPRPRDSTGCATVRRVPRTARAATAPAPARPRRGRPRSHLLRCARWPVPRSPSSRPGAEHPQGGRRRSGRGRRPARRLRARAGTACRTRRPACSPAQRPAELLRAVRDGHRDRRSRRARRSSGRVARQSLAQLAREPLRFRPLARPQLDSHAVEEDVDQ